MYCEKCFRIFEGDRCPVCRRSKVRQPEQNDLCFLTEQDYFTSTILEDLLNQSGVRFLKKEVMGAGLSIKVGPMLDRSRFYVPFNELEKASSVVKELSENPPEDEPEESEAP